MFSLKLSTLEVVGRDSETQLQVGENFNDLIQRSNGSVIHNFKWIVDIPSDLFYFKSNRLKTFSITSHILLALSQGIML